MAKSLAELKEAIANCEAILDAGATTVSVEGNTTVFDLDQVRKRLRDLQDELAKRNGKTRRRPLFNNVDLS